MFHVRFIEFKLVGHSLDYKKYKTIIDVCSRGGAEISFNRPSLAIHRSPTLRSVRHSDLVDVF